MVTNHSNLRDHHHRLVLDASVAINLLGTGEAGLILQTLGRHIIMDEQTIKEILYDPIYGRPGELVINEIVNDGMITRTRLSSPAYEAFLELTGADPPDDLGDGEAATIATATHEHAIPVIDERKARRVYSTRSPDSPILHTIDLLACPTVTKALGAERLGTIVYNALRHARMRVPPCARPWILDLIGQDRAKECPSMFSPTAKSL